MTKLDQVDRSPLDGRSLLLAVLIGVLGLGASVLLYLNLHSHEVAGAEERLDGAGEELVRVMADIEAVATEQVLAIRGFLESSVLVTSSEFEKFVEIIGEPMPNGLALAQRVHSDQLRDFVSRMRVQRAGYMIHDRSGPILAPGEAREYWPLVYSHVPETGFTEGFDLTSIPAVVSEIEVAFETDRPVATSFVSLPGDFEEGDVIIVAAVRSAQVPAGLAVATVRLDEALSERAEKLLGSDFDVELSEVNSDSLIAPNDDSPGTWASTVAFGGRRLLLIVAEDGAEASWGRNEVALVVSLLIAGAASWFAYSASRRRAVGLELAALQVSLREKDRFLASVSHELRTPLTAVVGILDILAADDVDLGPEERESLVSDARESAFDLERLVEDHLTAARLSAGALTVVSEIVDLDELMRSVVASLNLPSNLQVEVDRLGLCQGDRLRIRQIARNILRNGARYAVATIEVRLVQSRERVRIEFRNDGEAVSPAIVSRLFEPFVGLGQSGQPESIGLGLAISRDLARRMGGDLEYLLVEDQVCFALTLWPAQIDGLPESARPSVTTLRA